MIIPFQDSFDPESGKLVYQELTIDRIFTNLNIIFKDMILTQKTFFRMIRVIKQEYNIEVKVFIKPIIEPQKELIDNCLKIYLPEDKKQLQCKHLITILLDMFSQYFTKEYPFKLINNQETIIHNHNSVEFETEVPRIKEYLSYIFHPKRSPSLAFSLALQTHISNIHLSNNFDRHKPVIKQCLDCKQNIVGESKRNKYWSMLHKVERSIFEIQYFVYYLKKQSKSTKVFKEYYNNLKIFKQLYNKYYNKLDTFNIRGE